MRQPVVSIIIATRNRSRHLQATLAALSGLSLGSNLTAEVLVVDNGSTDDTRSVTGLASLRQFSVRYVHAPVTGKASALNCGIHEARGEVLAFIDDDVRPSADWLEKLSAPILGNTCDMVAGTVVLAAHLRRPWMTPFHAGMLASTEAIETSASNAAVGANMAFRRDVLRAVPGFDPELGPGRLGLWEDTLFSMQVRAAGFRLATATDAIVEHHFDPNRLSREAFSLHARAEARSAAYVAWHWEHCERGGSLAEIVNYRMLLAAKRWLCTAQTSIPEGLPTWELNLISGLEFSRHFRLERRRPRCYELRGLRKKRP